MNLINICSYCGSRNYLTRKRCGNCGCELNYNANGILSNLAGFLSRLSRNQLLYAVLAVIIIVMMVVVFLQWVPKKDGAALQIYNIQFQYTTKSSATITWLTNEPASSQVEYGRTQSYGMVTPLNPLNDPTVANTPGVTSHYVILNNLSPGTTYHFRVRSKNAHNNEAVSTQDMTFKTRQDIPFATVE